MFPTEPVTVQRTGAVLTALIDPAKLQVYLGSGVDVVRGDVLGFRGYTRRIPDIPEVWAGGGVVVAYEAAPAFMPDLGALYRPSGNTKGHFDPVTHTWVPDSAAAVWTGPCSVEPLHAGADKVVAEQQLAVPVFVVKAPLSLVSVQPDDRLAVTSSRDARLLTRTFVVQSVEAGSEALERVFYAVDRQD